MVIDLLSRPLLESQLRRRVRPLTRWNLTATTLSSRSSGTASPARRSSTETLVRLDIFRARFAMSSWTRASPHLLRRFRQSVKHFPDNTFGSLLGALKRTDRLGDALARDDSDRAQLLR